MLSAGATGGCTFLSKDGPRGPDIDAGARVTVAQSQTRVDYTLINLTPAAVEASKQSASSIIPRYRGFTNDRGTPNVAIGVGDIVSIAIFESEAGGLFIPKDAASRPGNFVQLPNQQVDASGNLSVPYVDGAIHVVGRTPIAIQQEITTKLKSRAVEPQVVVSVVEHRGNDVTVLGEVTAGSRFSIDPGGIRLSGAIAHAGGPKYPSYETLVTVKRRGSVQTAELSEIMKNPSQDLAMQPGDVVYLSREPRVFMVLGATPSPGSVGGVNNRRFTFENENMTLAEGISKAGGLDTNRASPDDFYLFRFESPALLRSLGIDVSRFGTASVPVIYKVDFTSADGFFLANKFLLRDKDVIFVSESASADIDKLLPILSSASGSAYNFSQATR